MLCCYVQYAIEMQTATHHTQKLTSDGKANAFDGGISAIQVQDKGTVMACPNFLWADSTCLLFTLQKSQTRKNEKDIQLIIHKYPRAAPNNILEKMYLEALCQTQITL